MTNYIQSLKSAIIRVYHTSGAVIGAGFLVSDCHALTCAHVVAAALSLPQTTQKQPDAAVEIDFPLVAPGEKCLAKVVCWQPVNPGQATEDIAGLEVLQPVPQPGQPILLTPSEDHWQHSLRVFGFPKGHDYGLWATGVLRDHLANGWVQLDALASQDRPIEPGFSGAPIWDEQLQGVVGMAVAAEKRRQNVTAAYMIPAAVLQSVWPVLKSQTIPASTNFGLSAFHKVKQAALEKREAVLLKQYEAAYNQLNYVLADANKVSIQEQIKTIERELQQVADEMTALLSS